MKGNYYDAVQLPFWATDLYTKVRSCNRTSFHEGIPDQKPFYLARVKTGDYSCLRVLIFISYDQG